MSKTLLTALAIACSVAACNSNSGNAGQNQDNMTETKAEMPSLDQLKGSWKLSKVGDLAVGFDTVLSFGEDEAGVFGAKIANSIFGQYKQIERRVDAVRFENMGSTKMLGTDEEMKVEDSFTAALEKVRSFRVEGDELMLIDEDDNVLILARKN